jgi:hypothetical protein
MKNNWGYYISGREIAILKQSTTTLEYASPDEAVANGFKVEYVSSPTLVADANSTIDVADELTLAVVDYVKSKFAENQGEYDKAQYHMREFKNRVYKYKNRLVGGLRVITPKSPYAIK